MTTKSSAKSKKIAAQTSEPKAKSLAKQTPIKKATAKKVQKTEPARKTVSAQDGNLPNAKALYRQLQKPVTKTEQLDAYCAEFGVEQKNARGTMRTRRDIARDLAKAMVSKRAVPQALVDLIKAGGKKSKGGTAPKRVALPENGPAVTLAQLSAWIEATPPKGWSDAVRRGTARDLRHIIANQKAGKVHLPSNLAQMTEADLEKLRSAKLVGRGEVALAAWTAESIARGLVRAYAAFAAASV